jgi:hypothetical protein
MELHVLAQIVDIVFHRLPESLPRACPAEDGFKVNVEKGDRFHRRNVSRLRRQLVTLIMALKYGQFFL